MKNYKNFILEKVNKKDLNIIYNKYYSDIERNIFNKIVESDPTSNIDGKLYLGKYSKWLLNLYKNNNLKLEDLYKVKNYIELFDKQSVRNKLPLEKRNINNYNSLSDLAKELDEFNDNEEILSKSEIKDKNFIKEFKNYNLFIPRTFKDSCVLGKGTEWCTATEKTDRYYKKYHKPGRELLIFINKQDPKEKYQFHFRTEQFMDKFDKDIDIDKFLSENPDINEWLKENVKDYKKINGNYDIDLSRQKLISLKDQNIPEKVEGEFDCSDNNLTSLKYGPKIVEGDFYCHNNKLTSLKYGPEKVEGDFNCFNNNLTSLKYGPKIVEGEFFCSYNKITSLEGAPKIVGGLFSCSHNKLTSLKGAPEIVEDNFDCLFNELTSLKYGPKKVGGNFDCSDNILTSLKGAPKKVGGNFYCSDNNLTSLKGAPKKVGGNFYCSYNNLTDKDIEWLKENCDIKGEIIR